MEPKILYEDNSIFVCVKPPKYPVQSDKTGDYDLLSYLVDYMSKVKKFDDPYVGLVHRIDRPVGGLVVFAKNPKATAYLSLQLQERAFKKKYLTVVNGRPNEDKTLVDYIKKKASVSLSKIVDESTPRAKKAILHYKVIETVVDEEFGELSLLEIELETGRHHQIRVQLAHEGYPIWGDSKYNPNFIDKKGWFQIALWAYSITFKHPRSKTPVTFKESYGDLVPFNKFKNQL